MFYFQISYLCLARISPISVYTFLESSFKSAFSVSSSLICDSMTSTFASLRREYDCWAAVAYTPRAVTAAPTSGARNFIHLSCHSALYSIGFFISIVDHITLNGYTAVSRESFALLDALWAYSVNADIIATSPVINDCKTLRHFSCSLNIGPPYASRTRRTENKTPYGIANKLIINIPRAQPRSSYFYRRRC